jgi:hypothetical protein
MKNFIFIEIDPEVFLIDINLVQSIQYRYSKGQLKWVLNIYAGPTNSIEKYFDNIADGKKIFDDIIKNLENFT